MSGDRVVSQDEVTIEDFNKEIDNWVVPYVHANQIYKGSSFKHLLRSDYVIKTEESDIQLIKDFETIRLLSKNSIDQHRKKFNYLHIGMVQIGVKPLTREGLNTSILICLRDCRHLDFTDSLLGTVETSLCNGPIYFDCHPNFTVSLRDQNILDALTINIKTDNYKMIAGSLPVSLIYRIHYKAMTTSFNTKAIKCSPKGETVLIQTDIHRSRMTVPKTIKWSDIKLPQKWELQEAVPPQKVERSQIEQIFQQSDGKVEISFSSRRSVDLQSIQTQPRSGSLRIDPPRSSYSTSSSKIPDDLESRISELSSQLKRMSSIQRTQLRMQGINNTSSIAKPVYQTTPSKEEESKEDSSGELSPPLSPTYSSMTENPNIPDCMVLTNDFQIDKQLLRKDFYSEANLQIRTWFMKTYNASDRKNIQEIYYNFQTEHGMHIMFFTWFQIYSSQHGLEYPFREVQVNSKTTQWQMKNGSVESIHPPLRQIGFDYQSVNINASPFKIIDDSNEVSKKDVSKIMEQNNFTNQHLHTIGQQLNRIEETVQTPISTVLHPTLDQPVFKPHEIPTRFNKSLSKPDFVSELDKKLVEAKRQISDSISNQLSSIIVPDTPEPSSRMTGRIAVLDQTDSDTNSISSKQSKTCPNELNKLKWKDPQKLYYSKTTPPDLLLEEKPQIFHNKYQANAIYEWNIDGMSEYNLLQLLQQMTMVSNAYKTQSSSSDHAIAQLLVAGFTGQLKGWWDYHLTIDDQQKILNAVKTDVDGIPIKTETGQDIQDAVSTLVFSISKHFIGDHSSVKDRSLELLSNLKCRKLHDFKEYKDMFLTRVMMRTDSNQPFWKEKFLAGLPNLLGDKVRSEIKSHHNDSIPYDQLTYGDLVCTIHKVGLQVCTDLKIQKQLKWEQSKSKNELGSFCEQFGVECSSAKKKHKSKHSKSKPDSHYSKPFRRKFRRSNPTPKTDSNPSSSYPVKKEPSDKRDMSKVVCYKCNKPGHYSKYCKFKKKLNELNLDDNIINKLDSILIQTSSDSSDSSEDEIDDIGSSSSSHELNVLTKDQELLFEFCNSIQDPHQKVEYLQKLKESFESQVQEPSEPYNLKTILERSKPVLSKVTLKDLQQEIAILKKEIKDIKLVQNSESLSLQKLKDYVYLQSPKACSSSSFTSEKSLQADFEKQLKRELTTNETHPEVDDDFLNVIQQVTSQKYFVKISLLVNNELQIDTIALFDTGADLNCIQEGLIPSKYFEKTKECLRSANGERLKINYKLSNVSVCNNGISFQTPFLLVKDISKQVILGTPFINLLRPYKVTDDAIISKILGTKVILKFLQKPSKRDLNILRSYSIHKNSLNCLIQAKRNQVSFLQDETSFKVIDQQLSDPSTQRQISSLQQRFELEVCADIPNAFWQRKHHSVTLPYETGFTDSQIPTKARAIQMNQELQQFCKKEIQDLLDKKLIRPSKSPWSCAAFYVNKNAEIERGVPRLVINYKPLNKALQWIRYPIPNKKDLLQKLHDAKIFSKFDMKSGFWQIQISECDRYKTAFTVPFGQYEWNVMPFGLKNAPSEFQKVMNDIFNAYSNFLIVYIDDVLVFSNSIKQHFYHLNKFFNIVKSNGLVVSKPKIKLFQTKIRFLGHYISQGMIVPIERSLDFASKFPDQILDKNQLQRFLGSLNYVADFFPNLHQICKPLHQRLKKNPKPWTDKHTNIVQIIKKQVMHLPCLHLADPNAFKIVETDASDEGYGGILKQKIGSTEKIVQFTSHKWNDTQQKYSTIKKEILAIVLCISKFQSDLLNQKFLLRTDCKSAKDVLQKDVKNLVSKHIFARWQSILSIFDFDIEHIQGIQNSLPDFLSREFLQGRDMI